MPSNSPFCLKMVGSLIIRAVNRFDMPILYLINQFAHRSLVFDEMVVLLCNNNFIKGGLVFAIMWYLWFQNQDDRSKRESLLAGVLASFVGLTVAKILTLVIIRPRPFNVPSLAIRIPYGMKAVKWEGLNSFPSDHAVLFFALATGIFFASRRAGWLMFIYISAIICLPRVFLGVHYPSDILGGAVIGLFTGWLFHLPAIRNPVTNWAFRWLEEKPGQFYASSFLLTYVICELFDPVISVISFIRHGHLP
jgi:membrane-associated phospholipid phosphatase